MTPLTPPPVSEPRAARTSSWQGTRVLILGLAREGLSLARFFAARGANVTVVDGAPPERLAGRVQALPEAEVRLALGADHPELVREADAFFVSPGVPEWNPTYQAALGAGLPVQSMTTLFFDLCPAPILGVTGSSGKTTTTSLIGHILRGAGRDSVVGGNIGDPMLDLLPRVAAETLVVLELSSFQLSLLRRSPHIAVVTNISPNHLDRHGTMERYVEAKRHIVEHQTAADHAVLRSSDPAAEAFAGATPAATRWFGFSLQAAYGATVRDGSLGLLRDGEFRPVMSMDALPLLGRHNVENALAALAAADVVGVSGEAMGEALRTFQAPPHRLQTVAERGGVLYVDDSIATSPERARVALEAVSSPVLLIAGGRHKNLPWEPFARAAAQRARAVFLIGEAAEDMERAVRAELKNGPGLLQETAVYRAASLLEAVTAASNLAVPGDVVLLSPACTSFDMFDDYQARGDAFARAVESLDAA